MECDPHIKYLIVMIDSENHDFIIEDLDDRRLVIKENMVKELQMRLEEVGHSQLNHTSWIARY